MALKHLVGSLIEFMQEWPKLISLLAVCNPVNYRHISYAAAVSDVTEVCRLVEGLLQS